MTAFRTGAHTDRAFHIGVFGRIAEHVGEDLRETREIAVDAQRPAVVLYDQLVPALVDERLYELDGGLDDDVHAQGRALQLDGSAADA